MRRARRSSELAGARIRKVYRRMVAIGRAIDDDSPRRGRCTTLRKRGKELRYLLEMFGGLLAAARGQADGRALKDLQDVLGRFQDREVQAAALRALRRRRWRAEPAARRR